MAELPNIPFFDEGQEQADYREESTKLISQFLVSYHVDKDDQSLWVRFNRLMRNYKELDLRCKLNFNGYMRALKENKELRDGRDN